MLLDQMSSLILCYCFVFSGVGFCTGFKSCYLVLDGYFSQNSLYLHHWLGDYCYLEVVWLKSVNLLILILHRSVISGL